MWSTPGKRWLQFLPLTANQAWVTVVFLALKVSIWLVVWLGGVGIDFGRIISCTSASVSCHNWIFSLLPGNQWLKKMVSLRIKLLLRPKSWRGQFARSPGFEQLSWCLSVPLNLFMYEVLLTLCTSVYFLCVYERSSSYPVSISEFDFSSLNNGCLKWKYPPLSKHASPSLHHGAWLALLLVAC